MEHDECCLYHGKKHRADFQFILNFLRENVTRKIDFARAGLLVCCCRLDCDGDGDKSFRKDAPTENQSSDEKVSKPQDEDLCRQQDCTLQSVLQMNMVTDKVQAILNRWIKRNPNAESHVHYGNTRLSGLMTLCLKGNYTPMLNMMFQRSTGEHLVVVRIPQKLVKPFCDLDMMELREKFSAMFEVLDSPLNGLCIGETLFKITCDKENITAVKNLLTNEAKQLIAREKKTESRPKSDSGCVIV